MTSIPARQLPRPMLAVTAPQRERLGVMFPVLLVWLCFEFGRPPNPFRIPLLLSLVSLCGWAVRKNKRWEPQNWLWLVLLAVMLLGIPIAKNNFEAFWTTEEMAVLFVTICLPLQSLVTSVGRVRQWFMVFLASALYVGGWAATHAGYGPSGSGGGQDENYVAALMCMAIAIGYFSLFAEKGRITRVMLVSVLVVFLAAVALAQNPSRGGFIGLCVVGLYCLARSPKKMLGIGVVTVAVVALVAIAGPNFWTEMATSTDTTTGTADMRIEIWKAGLRMWQANPIFGVGAGNFKWALGDYQTVEQFAKFDRSLEGSIVAHSLWVEMFAELGVAGVLATGVLVWRTWTNLGRMRNDAMRRTAGAMPDPELVRFRCYADAIRAGILAVLVNGLFLSLFYFSHLWLLLALGGGLTFLYRSRERGAIPGTPPPVLAQNRSAVPRRGGTGLPSLPRSQNPRSFGRGLQ